MPIVAVLFGWPAVIASTVLTSFGIALERKAAVLAGAALAFPFCLYLFLTPRFRWVALPVALLHFGAAFAVARRQRVVALALAAPFVALAAAVAWLVINQRAA